MSILPPSFDSALDVGARGGRFSRLLAGRAKRVVALDLIPPSIGYPRVENIAGDIRNLPFSDASFDVIFCTEVLEHVAELEKACRELARVTRQWLIVGVPYRQDTRVGRNTCRHCGGISPPHGHIHSFDENKLSRLMPTLASHTVLFAGERHEHSNALAARLMDWSGNPWGTYEQEEPCPHCGRRLQAPPPGSVFQRVLAAIALRMNRFESDRHAPRPSWVHILFRK